MTEFKAARRSLQVSLPFAAAILAGLALLSVEAVGAQRTDRLEALVCGGFPAMDGPYDAMLEITRAGSQRAVSIFGFPPTFAPETSRQFLTFYEGLPSLDDRAIQNSLSMPRLNWMAWEARKGTI